MNLYKHKELQSLVSTKRTQYNTKASKIKACNITSRPALTQIADVWALNDDKKRRN
jgi:hypothetical protein